MAFLQALVLSEATYRANPSPVTITFTGQVGTIEDIDLVDTVPATFSLLNLTGQVGIVKDTQTLVGEITFIGFAGLILDYKRDIPDPGTNIQPWRFLFPGVFYIKTIETR